MTLTPESIARIAARQKRRVDMWVRLMNVGDMCKVLELGVYQGGFAHKVLRRVDRITEYYMLDPWAHLDDWNKPSNKDSAEFDAIYQLAMDRTAEHAEKRIVLRGRTVDVIHQVPDSHLDLAYVDGDHTLRGIAIDLIRVWDKVRPGGWVGGDDFSPTIWQHDQTWEPTMVFPFAVYFAEAQGCPIYGLPFGQFLIEKDPAKGFSFTDLTGRYEKTDVLSQILRKDEPESAEDAAADETASA